MERYFFMGIKNLMNIYGKIYTISAYNTNVWCYCYNNSNKTKHWLSAYLNGKIASCRFNLKHLKHLLNTSQLHVTQNIKYNPNAMIMSLLMWTL